MKYLLVMLVVGVGLWLLLRARPRVQPPKPRPKPPSSGPVAMVACAHCDLRLPQAEAQFDAEGRPYCSEAHRLAGPR